MKQVSQETRRRMSEAAKRRCQTDAFRSRVAAYWRPFCTRDELYTDYIVRDMSQMELCAKYGVGLKRVQISLRRYGIAPKRAIKRDQVGEKNASWRGDTAGYVALHRRVHVARGMPNVCDVCGTTDPALSYDWANLTGNYADIYDYRRMCRSCHRCYDAARRGGDAQ